MRVRGGDDGDELPSSGFFFDIHHNDEEEVCNLRSRRQLVRRDKNL